MVVLSWLVYLVTCWIASTSCSMQAAAVRLVCHARKYDHVTHLLRDLHWLQVPERIQFRLAVLDFCCRNHTAPSYLADDLHWTDEAESRHRLRSGSCSRLIVPRTRLSTIGDRSFRVTVAQAWNSLRFNRLLSHICAPCPRSYLPSLCHVNRYVLLLLLLLLLLLISVVIALSTT